MRYLFLSVILGICAASIVWVIFLIGKDLNPSTLRRLEKIKRKSNSEDFSDENQINMGLPSFEYKFPALGRILKKYKLIKSIKELIQLADVNWHIDTFIFFSLVTAFPPLIFIVTPYKLMSLFAFVTIFIPTMYLNYLIQKRFLEFSRQFPDALNLMASSLRAGHPLFASLEVVTNEMPKPISTVFETAQTDISLGIDTKDAFLSMAKVMPKSIDLRFFITAVLIQKEVGGNLAELLDSLSDIIRERFKLMGQLRVQTAQTRLSGMVIAVVPVFVLLGIFFMNPEYVKPLFDTNDGQIALCVAIVLMIVGFLVIRKVSEIEF